MYDLFLQGVVFKWLHVSALFTRPSSGRKSLSRKLYNV